MIIPIILSLVLGFAHFWNEKLFFRRKTLETKARSFIAGISVAYIFLYFLPDLYGGVAYVDRWIFVFILLGFSLVHVLEKYFYQHERGEERLFRFKEVHYAIFLLYYFLLSVILVNLLSLDLLRGLLFFIPILFYAAVSRVSFAEIHTHIREQKILRLMLSFAPLLGVLAASFILNQVLLYNTLLAFVVGAFLYIAIMDFIPKESRGRPDYFLFGAGLYSFFVILLLIL